LKQREVPGELHGIREIQSIDKINEKIEILHNFFRNNLLFIEIEAQIRKAT